MSKGRGWGWCPGHDPDESRGLGRKPMIQKGETAGIRSLRAEELFHFLLEVNVYLLGGGSGGLGLGDLSLITHGEMVRYLTKICING